MTLKVESRFRDHSIPVVVDDGSIRVHFPFVQEVPGGANTWLDVDAKGTSKTMKEGSQDRTSLSTWNEESSVRDS